MVEFGKGCEVDVEIPSVAEWALMLPEPVATLKESCDGNLHFAPLPRGFGASLVLQGVRFFLPALVSAGAWEGRGTYRTG